MRHRNEKGFTLIELLIVVAIIGIIAAIAIPNLLNAIQRGKQKRTMSDIRSVGTACETYAIDNGYPPRETGGTVASLQNELEPTFIRKLPTLDAWKNAMLYIATASGDEYTVQSKAKGGGGSACTSKVNSQFTESICFSNGQFVQYPEGTQN